MNDVVYDLLIIFTDGQSKTISGVSNYHCMDEVFFFEKNGYRSFLPKENIKYFGRKYDWGVND
jgi:hypothetical protein